MRIVCVLLYIAFTALLNGQYSYYDVVGDGVKDKVWSVQPTADLIYHDPACGDAYNFSLTIFTSATHVDVAGFPTVGGGGTPSGYVPLICGTGDGNSITFNWLQLRICYWFGPFIAYENGPTLSSIESLGPNQLCTGYVYPFAANFSGVDSLNEGNVMNWSGNFTLVYEENGVAYMMFDSPGTKNISTQVDQGITKSTSVLVCAGSAPNDYPKITYAIATAERYWELGPGGPRGEPSWSLSDYQELAAELGWIGFENLPVHSQLDCGKTALDKIRYSVSEGVDPTDALEVDRIAKNLGLSEADRWAMAAGGGTVGQIMATNNPSYVPKIKGLPPDWKVVPNRRDGGVRYVDPDNPHNNVRVSPGNPTSEFPNSRVPNVKVVKSGKYLDKNGNEVPRNSAEAHQPLNTFELPPNYP